MVKSIANINTELFLIPLFLLLRLQPAKQIDMLLIMVFSVDLFSKFYYRLFSDELYPASAARTESFPA
jgi:hypothetical protein